MLSKITQAEEAIINCLREGYTATKEIANELHRSTRTVENELQHIYEKVEVRDKDQLIIFLFKKEDRPILMKF
jgi:DNA-binding NarL/FixJ family response regulator